MRGQYTPIACPTCGVEFLPNSTQRYKMRQGAPVYCSRKCYGGSRVTAVERACLMCGTPFMARADNIAKGFASYCSKPCSNKARAIPETDRFWALVSKAEGDECWLWLGARDSRGYGLFALADRKQCMAHRFAYADSYGQSIDGLLVCHHCDNPPCVRPSHLFSGTPTDNMRDMVAKGRNRNRWSGRNTTY